MMDWLGTRENVQPTYPLFCAMELRQLRAQADWGIAKLYCQAGLYSGGSPQGDESPQD